MMSGLKFGFGHRLPIIQQTETAECGTACLAMISCYYGHNLDMPEIRAKRLSSIKGTTLKQLTLFADELNLASRAVRLEIEDLSQLHMPCILHWDMNHFVVLKSADTKKIVVHDPEYGVRKLSINEASKHFSGVALELSPTPNFEEKKREKSVSLKTLLGNAIGLKRALFQILSLSVALEILSLAGPLFQQWVLDSVIIHNDTDLLMVLSIGFFMMMLLQLSLSTLRSWMVIYFSTQINIQWAAGVLSKLLRLPMDYFIKRHLGDVMSRFGAIQSIRQTLTSAALNSILDGLMAGVAFIMMWIYSPKLALITLIALALYLLVRISSYSAFKAVTEEQIIHGARQETHLLETVRGVQSIKLFNRESDRRNQWMNLLVNTTNSELASQRLSTLFQTANTLIFGIENILVVYVGAVLVMQQELSIGMIFAYGAYKMQFSSRISALVDLYFQLRMLTIQRERLADIVLSKPEPSGGSGMPGTTPPDIEVRKLRFRYSDNEPWVLDGITFKVNAGEAVAIVGPSGCGKTTLLKILLGLLQPTEGQVFVMGQPLNAIGLSAWRDSLGAVMQDDQLFAGTIAENIAFFAPNIDLQRVKECAQLAAVESDILAMPMTWQTLIGDMGAALSGGQKQRLLLARALYKQPSILLLDEATSHLDVERERLVNDAIRALSVTKIVIAHRQETINMADRIIALDDCRS
jgi:ATP-binding cassette subfamily B protein RaxB